MPRTSVELLQIMRQQQITGFCLPLCQKLLAELQELRDSHPPHYMCEEDMRLALILAQQLDVQIHRTSGGPGAEGSMESGKFEIGDGEYVGTNAHRLAETARYIESVRQDAAAFLKALDPVENSENGEDGLLSLSDVIEVDGFRMTFGRYQELCRVVFEYAWATGQHFILTPFMTNDVRKMEPAEVADALDGDPGQVEERAREFGLEKEEFLIWLRIFIVSVRDLARLNEHE